MYVIPVFYYQFLRKDMRDLQKKGILLHSVSMSRHMNDIAFIFFITVIFSGAVGYNLKSLFLGF